MRYRAAPRQSPLVRRVRVPGAALTILGLVRLLVPAAPAAPAKAAVTPSVAASSRSRRRHFSPPGSRENGGGGLCTVLREEAGPEIRDCPGWRSVRRGGFASRGQS